MITEPIPLIPITVFQVVIFSLKFRTDTICCNTVVWNLDCSWIADC